MKNQLKSYTSLVLSSLAGGVIALGGYTAITSADSASATEDKSPIIIETPVQTSGRPVDYVPANAPDNFVNAADLSVHSVVHVKVTKNAQGNYYQNPFEEFFFGTPRGQQKSKKIQGAGSGVIITNDGYIVTNNHVISDATEVTVMLNDNRSYPAKVIGTDPTTDIGLLKIEATDLPTLPFSNSDDVKVGEWVLAVGNPFNLTSTVTAGIVSAKGRNINIIPDRTAIESFIQTDAAVNPGNSGGALVNIEGELVGINTAISTHTGSFEGYSFAVPANIVKKVVDDLLEYGTIQRAYLGVGIANVTPELKEEMGLKTTSGVFISGVTKDGAAEEAGLIKGDIITKIDDSPIAKSADLLETIGRKRPGDSAVVTVDRNGKEKTVKVVLRNHRGTTELFTAQEIEEARELGAEFADIPREELRRMGLRGGVRIDKINGGKIKEQGIPEGFIIVRVNNKPVRNTKELHAILDNLDIGDGVLLQGYHKDGKSDYFAFGM